MQQQVIQFIQHHWILAIAFFVIVALILINEYVTKQRGPKILSTVAAIEKINHHDAIVIDSRPAETFRNGHILGAHSVSADNTERLAKYKNSPIILVCARGVQSNTLAATLRTQGFAEVMVLEGGMHAWQAAGLPVVKGKK